MESFQQRVIDEKSELDARLQKLTAFFETAAFAGVNITEQHRLRHQAQVMREYSTILGQRIAAFT